MGHETKAICGYTVIICDNNNVIIITTTTIIIIMNMLNASSPDEP